VQILNFELLSKPLSKDVNERIVILFVSNHIFLKNMKKNFITNMSDGRCGNLFLALRMMVRQHFLLWIVFQ